MPKAIGSCEVVIAGGAGVDGEGDVVGGGWPNGVMVITPSVEVLLAVTVMGKLTSVPLGAKIGEFVEAEPIAVVVVNALGVCQAGQCKRATVVVARRSCTKGNVVGLLRICPEQGSRLSGRRPGLPSSRSANCW